MPEIRLLPECGIGRKRTTRCRFATVLTRCRDRHRPANTPADRVSRHYTRGAITAPQHRPVRSCTLRDPLLIYAVILGTLLATGAVAQPAGNLRSHWAFATSVDVIGMNPAYLEKRLGPAKYKDTAYWTFQVGRCEITYNVNATRVNGYEFKLRPHCESSVRGYGDLKGTVIRRGLTFADVERLRIWQTSFSADCLTGCGNAADPWVYMDAEGSRSGGPYPIHFGVALVGDAIDAADKWERALGAKYAIRGNYLPAEVTQCGDRLNGVAAAAFAKVRIESVALGDFSAATPTDCTQLEREVLRARQ